MNVGEIASSVAGCENLQSRFDITFDDGDSESVLCSGKRGGETRCPAADHDRVIVDMRLHLGLVGFMRRNVADGLERTGEHAFGKLCFNAAFIAGLG